MTRTKLSKKTINVLKDEIKDFCKKPLMVMIPDEMALKIMLKDTNFAERPYVYYDGKHYYEIIGYGVCKRDGGTLKFYKNRFNKEAFVLKSGSDIVISYNEISFITYGENNTSNSYTIMHLPDDVNLKSIENYLVYCAIEHELALAIVDEQFSKYFNKQQVVAANVVGLIVDVFENITVKEFDAGIAKRKILDFDVIFYVNTGKISILFDNKAIPPIMFVEMLKRKLS